MFKNTAAKIEIFAFDYSTGAPKTGDATNITAYVSKDHGAPAALADTSATEIDSTKAPGWYSLDVTAAETNADDLLFTAKSTTSNVSLIGFRVVTVPGISPVTGTCRSGSDNSTTRIALAASTTAAQCPPGAIVRIIAGTGAGQVNKRDTAAVSGGGGSTPTATFIQAWTTTDSTSVYLIDPSDGVVPTAASSLADATSMAAVKAVTDKITFTSYSGVYYPKIEVTYINGRLVAGLGTGGSPWNGT